MKIRTSSAARHVAVLSATLAAFAIPAGTAHASAPAVHQAPLITRSPSGSCMRATVLAFQDRHVLLHDSARFTGAVDAALNHPHAVCPAVVGYLKQLEA